MALGASTFIVRCVDGLRASGHEISLVVSMPVGTRPTTSDDVQAAARARGLPYAEVENINASQSLERLRGADPDFLISAWPRVLRREALEVPRHYAIGTHPTALPAHRGRHPLHWLMVLGYTASKLTFFRMDEGVDTGPVLLQIPFAIHATDTITELIERVNAVAHEGALQLGQVIARSGPPPETPQPPQGANTWRKRTPHDVTLDFRMSADLIVRTVRSFTDPFPGALLICGPDVLRIVRSSVVESEGVQQHEPGKVMGVADRCLWVKAADRIVQLWTADPIPLTLAEGSYIHPPSAYFPDRAPTD